MSELDKNATRLREVLSLSLGINTSRSEILNAPGIEGLAWMQTPTLTIEGRGLQPD